MARVGNIGAGTLIASVMLLAAAAASVALGGWQLDRARDSRARLERFAAGAGEGALDAPPDDAGALGMRYRRVAISGRYEPALQFLVDNRVHGGVAGYEVLTPLRVPGVDGRVLVNRGWLPAGPDRAVLPDVRVDDGAREIRGRLDVLPRPGLLLGDSPVDREADGVVVVTYPPAAMLGTLLGARVHDYQILLDPDSPDGYTRTWHPAGVSPERHLAYAGQWLVLAVGAAGAAVVWLVRAARSERR